MDSIYLNAPAKINLSLDIVGILPNKYHDMRMIMQTISLYDKIKLDKNQTGKINIISKNKNIPTNEKNTAFKAALCFFKQHGIANSGIDISIRKCIPSQSGMGGGSADAAAVLIGLNKLFHTNMSTKELISLGKQIGADVPFCIVGGTALVEGIGEKITSLPPLPNCHIIIAKPNKGVSTKLAFNKFDNQITCNHPNTNALISAISNGDIDTIANNIGNVLEPVCNVNDVFNIKSKMLLCGALGAMMTGSGSAVFGIFNDIKKANACHDLLEADFFTALTKPLNNTY